MSPTVMLPLLGAALPEPRFEKLQPADPAPAAPVAERRDPAPFAPAWLPEFAPLR